MRGEWFELLMQISCQHLDCLLFHLQRIEDNEMEIISHTNKGIRDAYSTAGIFNHFQPLTTTDNHLRPFASTSTHFHPEGLPWSLSNHYGVVLNTQTYKWKGRDGMGCL